MENAADLEVSSVYSWALPSRSDPGQPFASDFAVSRDYRGFIAAVPPMTGHAHHRHHQKGLGSKSPYWEDHERHYVHPRIPPRTPQIGRLDSPELEEMIEREEFCRCCDDDARYQDGRAKMDSQRMSLLLSSSPICQEVRIEGCLKVLLTHHQSRPPWLIFGGGRARPLCLTAIAGRKVVGRRGDMAVVFVLILRVAHGFRVCFWRGHGNRDAIFLLAQNVYPGFTHSPPCLAC